MMSRVLSAEFAGRRVTIAGWVHRRWLLKSVFFLIVRDRAGLAQAVFHGDVLPAEESVIEGTGTVTANEQAHGGVEWLTGAANIRQVTAFPRDLHRLSP